MQKVYKISEYQGFVKEDSGHIPSHSGYIPLHESTFNQLEEFILSNRNADTDALELMAISARRGVGKVITAKNYVGVISMNDGTTIEIMPKICSSHSGDVKKLLVDMLRTLKNSPYKSLQSTNVNIEKLNIFEIFIKMFIDEVFVIVKHGLKCSYESVQDNLGVLKGKLKFAEHIRHNLAHKERFFVEYDEFNVNRPENKLIKATLEYLYKKSTSLKNRNNIRILLNSFNEVDASTNYAKDFSGCISDRNTSGYNTALMWCRVFLQGKSFTAFAGEKVAYALLFPMETLFESYIAELLRKRLTGGDYKFSAQDRSYYLFNSPSDKFLMKPDIVITRRSDNEVFVMDTKWKILSEDKRNYGISQADMYQMYAYQKKYKAQNVTLIYPKTDRIARDIEFSSEDGVVVKVKFVDLFDVENSMKDLINGMC